MKKFKSSILLITMLYTQSYATVFGGGVTECQRTKPHQGERKRQLRPVPLVADIVVGYGLGLGVDFLTGAIYKPCGYNSPQSYESVNIEKIVIATNTSQVELYNRAKKWVAIAFKSANNVIQLDDKENGKIIVKGCISYDAPAFSPGTNYSGYIYFTFSIDTKDGKYKYSVSDAYHQSLIAGYSVGRLANVSRKKGRTIEQQAIRDIHSLASSLETVL